jgi:hypothetical protein
MVVCTLWSAISPDLSRYREFTSFFHLNKLLHNVISTVRKCRDQFQLWTCIWLWFSKGWDCFLWPWLHPATRPPLGERQSHSTAGLSNFYVVPATSAKFGPHSLFPYDFRDTIRPRICVIAADANLVVTVQIMQYAAGYKTVDDFYYSATCLRIFF